MFLLIDLIYILIPLQRFGALRLHNNITGDSNFILGLWGGKPGGSEVIKNSTG